jgi:molybdopterin biosynthesis enzyme
MLQLREALARILAEVPLPAREEVTLSEAAGRVAAERLAAPADRE